MVPGNRAFVTMATIMSFDSPQRTIAIESFQSVATQATETGEQMRKTMVRLVAAVALAGAMLATGSPAHAGVTADPAPAVAVKAPHFTKVPVSGGVGALSYDASCFGYTGTFKDGSYILYVDWEDAGTSTDECFGIAPGRTIWHAWPGSGGWKVMPNNGRADDTWVPYYSADGRRGVSVYVAASNGTWCSTRNAGPGWGAWFRCYF
jgi:hypothetical protein